MSVEIALRLRLRNQAGELARVADQLGTRGVNIRAVAGVASGEESRVEFLVDNAAMAAQAWREAGTSFDEVQVALVWLPHTAGTLARAGRSLADAGINIESVYVVATEGNRALVAFGAANAARADEVLARIGG